MSVHCCGECGRVYLFGVRHEHDVEEMIRREVARQLAASGVTGTPKEPQQ